MTHGSILHTWLDVNPPKKRTCANFENMLQTFGKHGWAHVCVMFKAETCCETDWNETPLVSHMVARLEEGLLFALLFIIDPQLHVFKNMYIHASRVATSPCFRNYII